MSVPTIMKRGMGKLATKIIVWKFLLSISCRVENYPNKIKLLFLSPSSWLLTGYKGVSMINETYDYCTLQSDRTSGID